MGRDINEELFEGERKIVDKAESTMHASENENNPLLGPYKALLGDYKKLLRQSQKVYYISDSQGYLVKKHQSELQNLLDNANQGFLSFGKDLLVNRQYSAECVRIFGREIAGESIVDLLTQGEKERKNSLAECLKEVFGSVSGNREKIGEIPSRFPIGPLEVQVECKIVDAPESETDSFLVMMILTDISAQVEAEAKIEFLSYHDALTGLYNRAHVDFALEEISRQNKSPLSIVIADMNGLKLVNDVFGHLHGDAMLCRLSEVLQQVARQGDVLIRWGGDEFLLLLPCANEQECFAMCEEIRIRCKQIAGEAVPLSIAMGTATQTQSNLIFNDLFALAESRMYKDKLQKSKEFRHAVLQVFQTSLNDACLEKKEHLQRVGEMAIAFAKHLESDFTAESKKSLQRLAELHDIGKVAIAAELLGKESALTEEEREIVQKHSEIGYRLAQAIGEIEVAELILAVREHWDGSGYPYRLKREEIPFYARLFTIVDAYDVMTHDQPYRKALSPEKAQAEIHACQGRQFDPVLAEQFCAFLTVTGRILKVEA
ncbi:diguanylate cyclase domain-containing protein [uncultured Anaeromusa sp.]|uniref:HD-GYP domain-containing protein n=1 Tax=uncultured Anaeromusa sp. TaxID=673273 RepID=UPI0029C60B22|nr:diguanylate cyclase [uncultured Anaeromusa sp.]